MDGTVYRYLSSDDYHLYLSDELCAKKGYYLDEDHWLVKMVGSTKVYVTAVTGWEPGKIPSDGAQIHNDLAGYFNDHTLTACIAPHAFDGCTELKTLYFKDTDANAYDAATQFDFAIGDYAFANCPNLTEVKMMQYTTKGTNHWEALKPAQVNRVGSNVFSGSPQARFSTDASEYQNYLASATWKDYQNRVIVYNHTHTDMNVNGAQYSYLRNTAGNPLKNSVDDHTTLMESLRLWNADYQNFTASSLLSTSNENIWYTQVTGVDKSSLDNGTMRIYNDPGSVYNYKTIALQSLGQSKDVTAIEFWQTNGRSENSLSDLKMVIRNGALKGCTNLKELRMFYYVQDGDDHWEVLGPEDVIPSDNIFGIPTEEELEGLSDEEKGKRLENAFPQDFKILVSPDRYQDFINDPNWLAYIEYIEPADFNPNNSDMKDFSLGGLTYGYMTSPGGIVQTSQTVSQDVSWWTAPRIGIEVLIDILSLGTFKGGDVAPVIQDVTKDIANKEAMQKLIKGSYRGVVAAFDRETSSAFYQKFINSGVLDYLPKMIEAKELYVSELLKDQVFANGTLDLAKLASITNVYQLEQINLYLWGVLKKGVIFAQANIDASAANAALAASQKAASQAARQTLRIVLPSIAGSVSTAGYFASKHWGGTGSYNGDLLQKGMKANILSNIHQVGLVGGGYVITTPQKNLCYHTYIKDVPTSTTDAVIYAGTGKKQGRNNNARTVTMAKNAFRNHTTLKHVGFHETGVQSDEAIPMLLVIPDSAFVGCTNLEHIDLRVATEDNGLQALGPENFVLGGDSIFAGLDPAKFHIIIDPKRKQDFLDNESWKPLAQYFVYEEATPKTQYQEYGGNYAYAYENGTTQKVHKVGGHKIEHTVVTGADNEFLTGHQGALKLCNDIGVWNNFQLDAVTTKAFMGNENLRVVNFTDLKGTGAYGDSYTGLEMALMDSCFANCKNLKNIDMIYMVTDGDNKIDPIKPEQVTIGKGVLDGTQAKIKMLPQQVAWFEADTTASCPASSSLATRALRRH